MAKLTQAQLDDAVSNLTGWEVEEGELRRLFLFADFIDAMTFVNRVAELAEEHGHHPNIDIRYNKVLLGLVTHDEGGITQKDTALASAVDEWVA